MAIQTHEDEDADADEAIALDQVEEAVPLPPPLVILAFEAGVVLEMEVGAEVVEVASAAAIVEEVAVLGDIHQAVDSLALSFSTRMPLCNSLLD